jgi:hypothetical protein
MLQAPSKVTQVAARIRSQVEDGAVEDGRLPSVPWLADWLPFKDLRKMATRSHK